MRGRKLATKGCVFMTKDTGFRIRAQGSLSHPHALILVRVGARVRLGLTRRNQSGCLPHTNNFLPV
jgi:hypothetical protein